MVSIGQRELDGLYGTPLLFRQLCFYTSSVNVTNIFCYYTYYLLCCCLEFLEVGRPGRALDTLYEVFRNKKWAYNWSESVLEPIMFKYLELCVDLKKSHIAKEGLFQYRNMFQSVNDGFFCIKYCSCLKLSALLVTVSFWFLLSRLMLARWKM